MAEFRFSISHRVFMYESYVCTGSARAVRTLFQERFPGVKIPGKNTIYRLVTKFRETGSVQDKKPKKQRTVITEEILDNIRHSLENSPRKSLRYLSRQMGISYGSARTATKLLKLNNEDDDDDGDDENQDNGSNHNSTPKRQKCQ